MSTDRALNLDSSCERRHDSTDASASAECGDFGFIGLNTETIHLFPVHHWVPWTQSGKNNNLLQFLNAVLSQGFTLRLYETLHKAAGDDFLIITQSLSEKPTFGGTCMTTQSLFYIYD